MTPNFVVMIPARNAKGEVCGMGRLHVETEEIARSKVETALASNPDAGWTWRAMTDADRASLAAKQAKALAPA